MPQATDVPVSGEPAGSPFCDQTYSKSFLGLLEIARKGSCIPLFAGADRSRDHVAVCDLDCFCCVIFNKSRTVIGLEQGALMKYLLVCGLSCFSLCLTGCGGPSYGTPVTVKGKVTVGGEAPKDAQIIFQAKEKLPADKRTAMGPLKPDGTFEIANVYPAEYDVYLQSTAMPSPDQASAIPTATLPVNQDGSPITKPAKVPDGKNEFTFDF